MSSANAQTGPPPPPPPPPFRYHLLLCIGPSCSERRSEEVRDAFRDEIQRRGLEQAVRTTKCQCLDLCTSGPTVVVYPDGVWYKGVTPKDVAEIVREHLAAGRPVERLRHDWRPVAGADIPEDEDFLL